MLLESVNSSRLFTLMKHEMYYDCDECTKFSIKTCLSNDINSNNRTADTISDSIKLNRIALNGKDEIYRARQTISRIHDNSDKKQFLQCLSANSNSIKSKSNACPNRCLYLMNKINLNHRDGSASRRKCTKYLRKINNDCIYSIKVIFILLWLICLKGSSISVKCNRTVSQTIGTVLERPTTTMNMLSAWTVPTPINSRSDSSDRRSTGKLNNIDNIDSMMIDTATASPAIPFESQQTNSDTYSKNDKIVNDLKHLKALKQSKRSPNAESGHASTLAQRLNQIFNPNHTLDNYNLMNNDNVSDNNINENNLNNYYFINNKDKQTKYIDDHKLKEQFKLPLNHSLNNLSLQQQQLQNNSSYISSSKPIEYSSSYSHYLFRNKIYDNNTNYNYYSNDTFSPIDFNKSPQLNVDDDDSDDSSSIVDNNSINNNLSINTNINATKFTNDNSIRYVNDSNIISTNSNSTIDSNYFDNDYNADTDTTNDNHKPIENQQFHNFSNLQHFNISHFHFIPKFKNKRKFTSEINLINSNLISYGDAIIDENQSQTKYKDKPKISYGKNTYPFNNILNFNSSIHSSNQPLISDIDYASNTNSNKFIDTNLSEEQLLKEYFHQFNSKVIHQSSDEKDNANGKFTDIYINKDKDISNGNGKHFDESDDYKDNSIRGNKNIHIFFSNNNGNLTFDKIYAKQFSNHLANLRSKNFHANFSIPILRFHSVNNDTYNYNNEIKLMNKSSSIAFPWDTYFTSLVQKTSNPLENTEMPLTSSAFAAQFQPSFRPTPKPVGSPQIGRTRNSFQNYINVTRNTIESTMPSMTNQNLRLNPKRNDNIKIDKIGLDEEIDKVPANLPPMMFYGMEKRDAEPMNNAKMNTINSWSDPFKRNHENDRDRADDFDNKKRDANDNNLLSATKGFVIDKQMKELPMNRTTRKLRDPKADLRVNVSPIYSEWLSLNMIRKQRKSNHNYSSNFYEYVKRKIDQQQSKHDSTYFSNTSNSNSTKFNLNNSSIIYENEHLFSHQTHRLNTFPNTFDKAANNFPLSKSTDSFDQIPVNVSYNLSNNDLNRLPFNRANTSDSAQNKENIVKKNSIDQNDEMNMDGSQNERIRLESIKYQILTKLGLKQKPNITHSIPRHIIMTTLSRANEGQTIKQRKKILHRNRDGDTDQRTAHRPQFRDSNSRAHNSPSTSRPASEEKVHGNHNKQNGNQRKGSHNRGHHNDDTITNGVADDDESDDTVIGHDDEYGDDNDSDHDSDDFNGRTREIIIFAEKGE